MDPDCAVCHAPASLACDCEAKGLEVAIRNAEQRMMNNVFNEIRSWVRAHAQDYILEYFRLLADRRKSAHSQHLERLTSHAYHYYHAPPHPNEISQAQASLKRGLDEDWQLSVARYPEVLEYFYSLVDLTLPDDSDSAVKDPPLSALSGGNHRKSARRNSVAIAAEPYHERALPSRTPPPPIEHPSNTRRRHRDRERMTPAPIMPPAMAHPPPRPATGFRGHGHPAHAPPGSYYGGAYM